MILPKTEAGAMQVPRGVFTLARSVTRVTGKKGDRLENPGIYTSLSDRNYAVIDHVEALRSHFQDLE